MSQIVKYPRATTITIDKEGNQSIVYHSTCVVVLRRCGDIVLNSGGYHTRTTKQRMNQYAAGAEIFQRAYSWFVRWQGTVFGFEDGMILKAKGGVEYP